MADGLTLNPWLSAWLQPRQTIRQIVDRDPRWMLWRVCLLAGAANAVMGVEAKAASPLNMAIAAGLGALLSPVFLYLIGWFLRWTGSWFGGCATNPQVRAALIWSNVSMLELFVLWVPMRSVLPKASPVWTVYTVVALVVTVWGAVIFIRMLAEVHTISAWKAFWATGFPLVLVAVLALLLAIAVPNVIRGRTSANEAAAITRLQSLATAMNSYRATNGAYPGDWAAFVASPLIPAEFAGTGAMDHAEIQKFIFWYKPWTGGYELRAAPQLVPSRGFYVDQTGIVKHCIADQPRRAADAHDVPLDQTPAVCQP